MHKYGFHVNAVGDRVFDAIARIKPQVIKTLHHDVGFWRRVREIHPDAFIIGRLFTPNQEFQSDPQKRGREFAERILREEVNRATFDDRPLFDAWESFNEAIPESVDPGVMEAYDEFQVAFGQIIREGGFEPVAMNFGTGNFLGHHFVNHFQGTLETYRYLGFHEYDWPTMWRLHRESEAENGGMWLMLRYRRTMQEVRKEFPNRHTVIITECGMTQGVHPQGVGDVGPWHHSHPIPEDDYWASMMWYNDELMKDDYVMGACLFVVGAISPWETFEHLGGIINRLEQLQAQAREAPPTEKPAPVAEEVGDVTLRMEADTSAPSRDELESHYVLFSTGVGWDWYQACRFYFEEFRPTRGESLRDAARADVVTCINLEQETIDALREQNPSARLDVIQVATLDELADVLDQRIITGQAYEV